MSLFDLLKFKKPTKHLSPDELGSLLAGEITDQYKSGGHYKHTKDHIEAAFKHLPTGKATSISGYPYPPFKFDDIEQTLGKMNQIDLENKIKVVDDYIQSLVTQIEELKTVPVNIVIISHHNKTVQNVYYYEVDSVIDNELYGNTIASFNANKNFFSVYLGDGVTESFNFRYITSVCFRAGKAPMLHMNEFTRLTDLLKAVTDSGIYSDGKMLHVKYDERKVDELYNTIIKQ